MDDIMFGEEDAKYKKYKTKKKIKKSNHKHMYDKYCIVKINSKFLNTAIVQYCSICGKIYNMNMFPKEEDLKKIKKVVKFDSDDYAFLCDLKYI